MCSANMPLDDNGGAKAQVAVVLINPKYPHNVGGALRACAALGAQDLLWTGDRVVFNAKHLPDAQRRQRSQQSVQFAQDPNAILRLVNRGLVPVAVEMKPDAENLLYFEHPANAVYVFGPEDGSLGSEVLQQCHRFVYIPTHYSLNLAAAVNVLLYDRRAKAVIAGKEPVRSLVELMRPELPELAISGRIRDGFEGR